MEDRDFAPTTNDYGTGQEDGDEDTLYQILLRISLYASHNSQQRYLVPLVETKST